jgi:hypothetical protein
MKYLLRVLFILALSCGFASHARASSVDFHVQVLDPTCVTTPDAACTILPADPGTPFSINLTAQTCIDQANAGHIPGGLPTAPFGCFVGTNNTGVSLTGIDLGFDATLLDGAGCDTNLPGGAFAVSSCTPPGVGNTDYELSFSGGAIVNSNFFIILETGLPADDFIGTATVSVATPEPDSFLLLSTGAMMMAAGLFRKSQRRFAFGKK